jgi:hypothetical protein
MNIIRRVGLFAATAIAPIVSRFSRKASSAVHPLLIGLLGLLTVSTAPGLEYPALMRSADSARAARYEVFRDFQIKGICGTTRLDLAASYGANTLRTYTPPSREQLDQYQHLGLKVIVGIWMPRQGENSEKNGTNWDFDYREQGDEQLKGFEETLHRIGDHPAILMWCLGNEVPPVPAYLETVNRMSLAVHQRFPKQLTSLTMVNAPKEKIALVKQYAPDLDVIGYNSYGQGAVSSASQHLEQDWGRAYYVSEFGPQGPWWGRKTAWGENYEQSYDQKLDDLRKSFQTIDAAPRCLGSTMFLWGCWTQQKPTYFSAFLSPQGSARNIDQKQLYTTPMSEEFCHYWSGKYPSERAPILTKISVGKLEGAGDSIVQAGESFKVTAIAASPGPSNSKLEYRWWILDKRGQTVAGPINTDEPSASLRAPKEPGTNYVVMAYVIAADSRASGFTVPIKVQKRNSPTTASNPIENADQSHRM